MPSLMATISRRSPTCAPWRCRGGASMGKTLRPVAAVYRVGATRMQDVIADCGACQVIPVVDLELFGTSVPGEAWAVKRVTHCIRSIAECVDTHGEGEIADGHRRFLIEITDTTRPDVAHKSCHVERAGDDDVPAPLQVGHGAQRRRRAGRAFALPGRLRGGAVRRTMRHARRHAAGSRRGRPARGVRAQDSRSRSAASPASRSSCSTAGATGAIRRPGRPVITHDPIMHDPITHDPVAQLDRAALS